MSYEPKAWECGDVITADDLNHLEQGVANASGGDDSEFVYVHINQETYTGGCVMEEDYTGQELYDLQNSGKNIVGIWTTLTGGDDRSVRMSVSASPARGTYGTFEGFDFGFIESMYYTNRVNATHILVNKNSNSLEISSSKHVDMVNS